MLGERMRSFVGRRTVETKFYFIVAFYNSPHQCKACGHVGMDMYKANGTAKEYCSHKCLNTSDHAWAKRKATTRSRFGSDNIFGSEHFKKVVVKTFEEKYGKGITNPSQAKDVKVKKRKKFKANYGVDHWMKADGSTERLKASYSREYGSGVTNAMQVPGVVDKMRENSLRNHGVPWSSTRSEVREKTEKTNLRRYGVKNASMNPKVRAKISSSLNNLWQDPERSAVVRGKMVATFQERWGDDHPSKNADYHEKHPGYKNYTLERDGRCYQYQGYEDVVINEALDQGLLVKSTGLPTIRWGGGRVYHPDLLLHNKRTGNTIMVEVKSIWTLHRVNYGQSLETNLQKFKAARGVCAERGWVFYLALVSKNRIRWLANPTKTSVSRLIREYRMS